MTKYLRLVNGEREWILHSSYDKTVNIRAHENGYQKGFELKGKEVFNFEELNQEEILRFQLYVNRETIPTYCFDMTPRREGNTIVLTDASKPEILIKAQQSSNLSWKFKLLIDGVETLPELNHEMEYISLTEHSMDELYEIKKYISSRLDEIEKEYSGNFYSYEVQKDMAVVNAGTMLRKLDYKKYTLNTLDELFSPFNKTFFQIEEELKLFLK